MDNIRPAVRRWHFWDPASGLIGGLIFGSIIGTVIVLLYRFIG